MSLLLKRCLLVCVHSPSTGYYSEGQDAESKCIHHWIWKQPSWPFLCYTTPMISMAKSWMTVLVLLTRTRELRG